VSDVWGRLLERRFKPSEVEAVTGVKQSRHRKWVERYLKDLSDAPLHWRQPAEGAHSRYTWEGVQMLALFGEVLDDVGPEIAVAALLEKKPQNLSRSDMFTEDLRGRDDDTYLFWSFDNPGRYVTTTSIPGLARIARSEWGSRMYLYNLSALQRRLSDKAATVLKDELAVESA
jgi:hypothetical protein